MRPVDPQPSERLFTVGIPVFNGKSLLRNCLQSVINSTFPRHRFEIVIADDGSTEPETLAILGEFEKSLAADPGFFRVISLGTNSGGAARPRNRILDEATGEYIFFVDSDDTIGNQALERIAEAVAATPADWVAVHQVPVNGRAAVAQDPPVTRRGAPRQGFGDADGAQGLPTRRDRAPAAPVRRGTSLRTGCELRLLLHPERVSGSSCSADTTTTTSRSTPTTQTNPPTSRGAPRLRRHSSRRTSGSCARCSRPCGRATFPNPNGGRSSARWLCPGS